MPLHDARRCEISAVSLIIFDTAKVRLTCIEEYDDRGWRYQLVRDCLSHLFGKD